MGDDWEGVIAAAVKARPYPAFNTISDGLRVRERLDLMAEYGEVNHGLCKTIYENTPHGVEAIVEAGKAIYARGGMQALQRNYYVIIDQLQTASMRGGSDQDYAEARFWLEKTFEQVTDEWKV